MDCKLFNDSKYTRWYKSIIDLASACPNEGYVERHHILPRSLGGSDSPENIVALSARQHFVCHQLLIRMVDGANRAKMMFAIYRMVNSKRYKVTSTVYSQLRLRMHNDPEVKKRRVAGQNRPETKALKSKVMKEYCSRPEVKRHRQRAQKAANARPEVRERKRIASQKYWSKPESRKQLSEKLKGKRHKCSLCGKIGHKRTTCQYANRRLAANNG